MITIQNEHTIITVDESGADLTVYDVRRRVGWRLDYASLVYGRDHTVDFQPQHFVDLQRLALVRAEAAMTEVSLICRAGDCEVTFVYALIADGIEVRLLPPSSPDIGFVALPGSFIPVAADCRMLLPIMQGMQWDGRGPAFSHMRGEAGHLGFSMPFLGYLAQRGGLLVIAHTSDDVQWWYGKDVAGRCWATAIQIGSLGSMRYERVARLHMTDPEIAPLAKRYRRTIIEQGRFKNWDEKIAERPYLEQLFGTLMTFIGYCQDDIDYVAECRKLKAYGFDRALLYPARFNMYKPDIHMGGKPAIDIPTAEVEAIKQLGYQVAPWSWLNEALDDKSERVHRMLRKDSGGNNSKHWAIDDQQWYLVCHSFLPENQMAAMRDIIPDMTWDHFDVLTCVPGIECYALDHANHQGRAMSRGESREWIRKVLKLTQQEGRIVSSENFNDHFALEYDLGSVKAWPQFHHWPFWPVPLTMLVYHDSMIHSWWEVHSYNNPWSSRAAWPELFEYGGGRPRLMAALDALMGCPPDVFPFGAQYGYTSRGKESFLYRYRFEDPEVQIALREALPVARLHRRIGKLEMVDFRILSENGYIQEARFADGTRVVANFSRDFCGHNPGINAADLKGIEALAPESWGVFD